MTDIDIRNPIPVDQVDGWLTALNTALLGSPYLPDFARRIAIYRREWDPERVWGAQVDGRWIATLATEARRLSVPGSAGTTEEVVADGVTGVSVSATHRRRGLLTAMLGASQQAARDRGEPVSILIAAEWGIYGRYGYAPASDQTDYIYYPRRPHAAIAPSGTGTVRQIEPDEAAGFAATLYDRARRQRVGQIDRPGDWWSRRLGLDGYERPAETRPHWIVREGPDGPDGLLAWRVTGDFEVDGTMGSLEVQDLIAANDDAYRDLWAYLSGIDLIGEISLPAGPVDESARWLTGDGRALRAAHTGDGLWLRLLDVPAALAARRYAVADRLVLDVLDAAPGGYGQGRFALDGGPDGAQCSTTTESADLQVTQPALAAVYLGGRSLRQVAVAGGVVEVRPGALARADAMLATATAPWNATMF
jgi:predicted acetyltransferase